MCKTVGAVSCMLNYNDNYYTVIIITSRQRSGVVVSGGVGFIVGGVGCIVDGDDRIVDGDGGDVRGNGGGGGVGVGSGSGSGRNVLFRSRSLPHLLGNDSGVGGSFSDGGCADGGLLLHGGTPLPGHCSKSQPAGLSVLGDIRQLVTLKQHYYPEGGWGWVVAAVAVAAHLLTHGLHLASGVFVQELVHKFGPGTVVPAGIVCTLNPQIRLDSQSILAEHNRA